MNGKLDNRRGRRFRHGGPSTIKVALGAMTTSRAASSTRSRASPRRRPSCQFMGYRNMLEKLAERYQTTPDAIVALERSGQADRAGPKLRLPNVVPASRDYRAREDKRPS